MISYSLTKSPTSYSGGSVLSKPTTTVFSTVSQISSSVPVVGGLLSNLVSSFGPEDWSSVEQRFRGYFEAVKAEVERRMQQAKSLADLTDADRYLSVATGNYSDTSYWKSENSIRGHALVGNLLKQLQETIRQELSKNYQLTPKRDTTYVNVYKDPRGFSYGDKGVITYMVYTNKAETRDPAQTIDVNGNPIQNVGTTPDVKIPTDSPYFESPKENESSFNWLYVIIPAVAVGLWKLGEWAYKKLKK